MLATKLLWNSRSYMQAFKAVEDIIKQTGKLAFLLPSPELT